MAKDQPNVFDLLPFLESTDLHELEQVRSLLQESLSTDKGSVLVNDLVDYYLDTNSPQAADILSSVREPHDKHLLDKMNECMAKQSFRLPTLTLLGHVIRKQPSWIHKIPRFPLLASLLKCLKTESDIAVLITGVLVLIILLPMIPQTSKQLLFEFFDIFGRLAAWNQRNPGHAHGVYAVHLHASVYSLFHRLYGMYPCNFVSYLRAHYSMKENVDTFEEVVKPMLEHVRIHPELVTGTKDYELDPNRWKRFETHDIVIECAKVSLDPKEASCEEGYSSLPDHVPRRPVDYSRSLSDLSNHGNSFTSMATVRQSLSLSLPHLTVTQHACLSPQTPSGQGLEATSSGMKEVLWSPSSACGMSTPPSSRGMSPTTVSDLSHSASHLSGRVPSTPVDGKWTPSASTPSGSSPLPSLSEELEHTVQITSTTLPPAKANQELIKELKKGTPTNINSKGDAGDGLSPITLMELSDFVKRTERDREEDAITEAELQTLTHGSVDPLPTPGQDSSFSNAADAPRPLNPSHDTLPCNLASTPDRGPSAAKGVGQHPPMSSWPCFTPIENSFSPCAAEDPSVELSKGLCPYEPLFDLALPRLASLFVEKRTAEAQRNAGGQQEHREELEGEDLSATSPLEVLDRLIQQGNDLHEKVLKRSPSLSSQSSEPHSGGKHHSAKGKGISPGAPDELTLLRSQQLLLHNQLLYERHKREQHALRNRRLLRRVINATALEEQNSSMTEDTRHDLAEQLHLGKGENCKAQLRLQEVEIQTLRVSLQEERQRSKHLQRDSEALVQQLHSQVQQLQQERNDYHTKTQELQSDLQDRQKRMGEMEAELQRANNKLCNTGHLLSQLSIKLNNSESMEQQMAFLNKQLLLLGEANKLCVEEIQRLGPEADKELKMLQACSAREVERLRQSSMQQSQRLEAAQQRIADLEAQLTKKEHLILEQKKLLENVKAQAKGQLQASENRYLAQKHVTQALQSELLQLYSQLEINSLSNSTPAGGAAEPSGPPNKSPNGNNAGPSTPAQISEPSKREESSYVCVNGDFSPGSPPSTALINGSQEEDLSLLSCNSPLDVGSCPSAQSFLGIHNQELLNKRKSRHEEEPAPLTSLSHDLQEHNSEPVEKPRPCLNTEGMSTQSLPEPSDLQPVDRPRARAYNIQRRRQQDLRIMDYNETH
ncbi:TSC complex subunit 1a isoform X2 [Colossoma macropomum]|uniref:TSC complex subunit 1a isoform X2 n=1 Tax=Colossoma macropomum TaxID=42526 RepID=UPI001864E008|nr:TSC complex subunit 1a isoform X2 [Colossoma macropomum]